MTLKDRMKRLLERHGLGMHVLVCPVCEEEFVILGDAVVDYVIADWVKESDQDDHNYEIPPAMAAILDHEHEPSNFREKTTGLPFLSREISGMGAFGEASGWDE